MSSLGNVQTEFVTESAQLLTEMETGLLGLEQGIADAEGVNTLFRAVHAIKGGAAFVGMEKIEKLAQKMEDLLNLVRGGDLEPSQPVTDSLLQSLDVLATLFQRVNEHESIDIDGAVRSLEAALSAGVTQDIKSRYDSMNSPVAGSGLPAFHISKYLLASKLSQGNLFYIHLNLSRIEERGLTPIQLINEMLSMGELIDSKIDLERAGDPGGYDANDVCCHVLYSTVLEAALLAPTLRLDQGEFRLVTEADFIEGTETGDIEQPQRGPSSPRQHYPAITSSSTVDKQDHGGQASQPPVVPYDDSEPEQQTASLEFLTISLGKETYGVNILSVQEIIGIPSISKLPRSPEHVLGVMNLRGMVVPVIDLRKKFNMPDNLREPVIVVVRVGSKIIGAVVDEVNDVALVSLDDIQSPPEFSGKIKRDYISGLTRHNGELVIMLELDKLLAPEATGDAA